MGYLWLKSQRGATLTYTRFRATRNIREAETARVQQLGLRGTEYSHLVSERDVWSITISPDELHGGKFIDLEDFWRAHRWWISEETSEAQPLDSTFVEVVIPAGRMPIEYIGNHQSLRQVSFDAREKKSKSIS